MEKINIVVEENANWRLDKIVAKKMPEFSRTRIQEMINQGLVLVNQKMEKPSYKIRIGDQIDSDDEQLKLGAGYDHPFIFNQDHDQVVLYHEKTGRKLTVSTTLPGAQIYSANYLDGRVGKYGIAYPRRYAMCIETQNLPDAINIEENPTTILKKGEVYDESTSYTFEVIK